ncbi:hypothetical protein BpHYR1_030851 [Brachionus plicatilis]|uniref:Uncharacterized protein n=1 Tax=Brachionus plicatilis TaxID=10195 RepID=A0A3M7Q3L7_BRAPC|nr:hypothetical protein BpHYR1_030851 [Brachionus plicatilis]
MNISILLLYSLKKFSSLLADHNNLRILEQTIISVFFRYSTQVFEHLWLKNFDKDKEVLNKVMNKILLKINGSLSF